MATPCLKALLCSNPNKVNPKPILKELMFRWWTTSTVYESY